MDPSCSKDARPVYSSLASRDRRLPRLIVRRGAPPEDPNRPALHCFGSTFGHSPTSIVPNCFTSHTPVSLIAGQSLHCACHDPTPSWLIFAFASKQVTLQRPLYSPQLLLYGCSTLSSLFEPPLADSCGKYNLLGFCHLSLHISRRCRSPSSWLLCVFQRAELPSTLLSTTTQPSSRLLPNLRRSCD